MNLDELKKLTHGRDMDLASATEVVNWAHETFKDGLALSSGFTADDMVLLDMMTRIGAKPNIIVADSARLFPETYEFIEAVTLRYRPKISFFFPDTKRMQSYLATNGPNAFRHNHALRINCCEIRRQEPLKRALKNYKAWMAGLRRSQSGIRQNIHKISTDPMHGDMVKICPLADWSWEQVWAYAKEHGVPMHPLYEKGFMSIGCEPCTRQSSSGDERAGRWWWEEPSLREDGVHF